MLTSDLLRVRQLDDRLEASYVAPGRRDLAEPVAELCALVRAAAAERWSRGVLDEAVETRVGTHRSRRALLGMARLLLDKVETEVDAPVPPADLRQRAFALSRDMGPLGLPGDLFGRATRDDVLQRLADELGHPPDVLDRALYADLRENHVVVSAEVGSPEALVDRYNVALVQGVLLRAIEVHVTITSPSVPRVRQLLRHAKFHQLMHRAWHEGEDLHLVLDGPASVLQQSSRYGLQLALFFPALLLQTGRWKLTATVLWGPTRQPCRFQVGPEAGLRSHLPDTGAWTTPEQGWFRERWDALGDTGWDLTDQTLPIPLGHEAVVLPDFTFTHRADGRRASLDIVGFWRKDWLARRMEALKAHGPGNLVLAVSRKLHVAEDDLAELAGEVVSFAQIVPARDVLAAVERVAR
jgi:predicted nuclease of restriction endonuclease-like RecB superfamily